MPWHLSNLTHTSLHIKATLYGVDLVELISAFQIIWQFQNILELPGPTHDMSIQWTDHWEAKTHQTLPRLIKSYIDKEDFSHAVRDILRLTELLILSSHFTEAHLIASAVFRLVKDFEFTDKGENLDFEI